MDRVCRLAKMQPPKLRESSERSHAFLRKKSSRAKCWTEGAKKVELQDTPGSRKRRLEAISGAIPEQQVTPSISKRAREAHSDEQVAKRPKKVKPNVDSTEGPAVPPSSEFLTVQHRKKKARRKPQRWERANKVVLSTKGSMSCADILKSVKTDPQLEGLLL